MKFLYFFSKITFISFFANLSILFANSPFQIFPSLEVTPLEALIDQETTIIVKNLKPRELIIIKAEAFDENNTLWVSTASFNANEKGVIDLSLSAPIFGTYSGIDPMGLLWSMEAKTGSIFVLNNDKLVINLYLFRNNEKIASTKITRFYKSSNIKKIPIRENGIMGILFLPPSAKPLPIIMTFSGGEGGFVENRAKLLASHGFAVFALAYFGVEGLPSTLQDIPLEYFERAFNWLKYQPNIDGSRIGIYGSSRGAELSLILASLFPHSVQAIVATDPSSAIYGGFREIPTSGWLYEGKSLVPSVLDPQFILKDKGKNITNPYHSVDAFLKTIKNEETFNSLAIPVEKIQAPLLLVSGGDDQIWPSSIFASKIEERLKKYNSTILRKHLNYPKAGHWFNIPDLPQHSTVIYNSLAKGYFALGGTRKDNWHACQDSWKKIIEFFNETLKLSKTNETSEKFSEFFVEAKEAKIFCRSIGRGAPIIVIHGGPGLSQDYLLPIAKLKEHNRVIFYDQRCSGRSTGIVNENSISIKTFIEDLEAIRKSLGYTKITLLGHSWGGILALHYANTHPESVSGLILSNTLASKEGYDLFLNEVVNNRITPYQDKISKIEQSKEFTEGDPITLEKYYQIIFGTYLFNPSKINLLKFSGLSSTGTKVFEILNKNVLLKSFDLLKEMKSFHIPSLLIHGDSDPISPQYAQKMHESIPNSKYILLKDCGHFSFVEDPDNFFMYINQFLKEEGLFNQF